MSPKRSTRASLWFTLSLLLSIYVVVSASIAVATADACDGTLHGQKTWQVVPPRWECPRR